MYGSNRMPLGICLALVVSLGFPATIAAVTFGPAASYPVGTNPSKVVVGDFNGDGKLDLAVANSGSNFVSILLGNGDGTFQPALMADAGGGQASIGVGDFNGDGKLDLVVNSGSPTGTNGPFGVSILLGNGDGTFQPPVQIQSYANGVIVAVGDFNRDGKLDMVVSGSSLNGTTTTAFLNIFLGKGDGTFQAPTSITWVSGSPISLAVADFNGDGKPDLAVGQAGPGELRVQLGNGDGTFQPAVVTSPVATTVYSSLVVGDFNGDGKQDLAARVTSRTFVCNPLTHRCGFVTNILPEVLPSNGDGTFSTVLLGSFSRFFNNITTSDVAVGDVNGDGKLDVAVFRSTGSVAMHLGKGDGTFPVVPSIAAGTNGTLVDLNGDKLADLISVDPAGGMVSIFLNTSPASGADLSVNFTSIANPVVQGQNGAYTAAATNFGPQDATGVVLTIDLPANTTFVSAVPTQGTCNAVQLTITCALGPMPSPSAASATITLTPTVPGMDTISASVAANEQDLAPTNNMASATFTVIPIFTLTVMKAGAGGGTVTDNSGMINCGTTCSATYPNTATVALTAAPDATSAFAIWSGACTGTDPNSCSIPMTSDMTVTATFVPAVPLTVSVSGAGAVGGTVTSTPPGINCTGTSCTTNFATGSTVNLTASAASGATFMNWSGACTGTDPNTCLVAMTAAQSVTATFLPPATVPLTVNIAGTGGGTVTSTPSGINCTSGSCVGNFAPGTTVNLKAVAAAGSGFTGWSGGCIGTDPNTCAINMNFTSPPFPQSATATFGPPPDFMLNLATALSVAGGGQVPDTITLNPQNGALNSVVMFTCSVSPALAECSFTPPSLTLGASPVSTVLNIVAIKPPGSASLAPRGPEWGLFASLWLPIPALILAGIGFGSKHCSKKKLFASLLLVCLMCAGIISQSGCGGSSINSTFTPPGAYNVTITATSGSIVHSQTVTLTVQ